jgi:hypothetical protein
MEAGFHSGSTECSRFIKPGKFPAAAHIYQDGKKKMFYFLPTYWKGLFYQEHMANAIDKNTMASRPAN